jgi:hypothetical protein
MYKRQKKRKKISQKALDNIRKTDIIESRDDENAFLGGE